MMTFAAKHPPHKSVSTESICMAESAIWSTGQCVKVTKVIQINTLWRSCMSRFKTPRL